MKRLWSLVKALPGKACQKIKLLLPMAKALPKALPKLALRLIKASPKLAWRLIKTSPRALCKCLNFCWSLTKRLCRLAYACMQGFAMFMVCCILVIGLIASLDLLPHPGVRSIQLEKNLPLLIQSDTYDYRRSIVRLYDKDEFFCSGVVIGKNYLLTASHCLVDDSGRMEDKEIIVVNDNGSVVVGAKAAGVNLRMDWGLVQGDFSKIPGALVAERGFVAQKEVTACGYPQGAMALTCQTLVPYMNDAFLVKCRVGGMLFPGMSGGPVFDERGVVVGLNVLVYPHQSGGGTAYSPTTAILANFGIADAIQLEIK